MKDFCYILAEALWHLKAGDAVIEVKIGSTDDPCQRLKTIRTSRPNCQIALCWFEPGCGDHIEDLLHRYYHDVCIGGEFYKLPRKELAWLNTLPTQFFLEARIDAGWPDWDALITLGWRSKWKHSDPCESVSICG